MNAPPRPPIRGVLFDVDDTLVDYSASEAIGVVAHMRAEGLLDHFPTPAAALALWRTLMEAEYARFLAGELTFTGQQRERTRKFFDHIGQTAPADHEAWFGRYKVHRDAHRTAFPDAEPVLRALAPDYRLGIVSNSSVGHQRRKLESVGLLHHFGDAIVCSDPHGAAKPTASIFLAGCAAIGLEPSEVAYVGDKYPVDALGSHGAGLLAIWLDRADTSTGIGLEPGIRVIRTLEDLPAALAG